MSLKPLNTDRRAVVVEIPLQLLTLPQDKRYRHAEYEDPDGALAQRMAADFGIDRVFRLAGIPEDEPAALRLACFDDTRGLLTVSVKAACLPLVPIHEMLPRVRVQMPKSAAARPSKFGHASVTGVVEYARAAG